MPEQPDLSAMNALPLLISPPGMDAPLGLANYTPDLGMMHPSGTVSPRGMLQVTPIGPKHLGSLKSAFDTYSKKRKQGDGPHATEPPPKVEAEAKPPKTPSMPKVKLPKEPAPKLRPPKVR